MSILKWTVQWLVLAFFLYGGAEAINSIDIQIGGEQYLPKNIYIKIVTALASSAIVLWLTHRHRTTSQLRKNG
ncbi:MAG: hypothetical protein J0I17_00795 ['Candidatus Kapabacteria' thiocyanatum]|uniref:Uncharacterized protein n=1 Tax=Candidatus Kapaibacterium thiocyanatum TaxID=1895771 RepID=A0A1M3KWG9_9BACT|nr:hypothetical protein ['Candidatus Kapabacteria' thiocyanatum]OJX56727.1 MAG: hypothetical protein BGO89_09315 ['Candidatus Kapabacteria' thiocyanatum]